MADTLDTDQTAEPDLPRKAGNLIFFAPTLDALEQRIGQYLDIPREEIRLPVEALGMAQPRNHETGVLFVSMKGD